METQLDKNTFTDAHADARRNPADRAALTPGKLSKLADRESSIKSKAIRMATAAFVVTLVAAPMTYADTPFQRDHPVIAQHQERHVWTRGERGYDAAYGAPYWGAPYYGADYYGPAPAVGIQLPRVVASPR